jgi:hypothetical protein
MGVSVDTLTRYYEAEITNGKCNVDMAVAGKLVSAATAPGHSGPTITAAIFYAKTRMGWRERVEVSGPHGGSIETSNVSALELIQGRLACIAARQGEDSSPSRVLDPKLLGREPGGSGDFQGRATRLL